MQKNIDLYIQALARCNTPAFKLIEIEAALSDFSNYLLLKESQESKPAVNKAPIHIICLAAAKHYRLRPAMTAKAWIISLVKIGCRADKFIAKAETYWEAERLARVFLEAK